MPDIALVFKEEFIDVNILNSQIQTDGGLTSSVIISLFTDRRVTDEQLPEGEGSKRGFWGDRFSEVDQDQIGSRLWTLTRSKRTTETLRLYEDYTREALNWLIEDGIAASIEVNASYDTSGNLKGEIAINRPIGQTRFSVFWDAQKVQILGGTNVL